MNMVLIAAVIIKLSMNMNTGLSHSMLEDQDSGHWCRIAKDVNVLMMRLRIVQGGDDIGIAHEIDYYKN